MAFNITSWSRKGRGFGRGEPPPRGSIEYVAVGDMWTPEPPRPVTSSLGNVPPPREQAGSYTEMDAADRWMNTLDRSVSYARQIHGDKILSKDDAAEWAKLMSEWTPFRKKHSSVSASNRKQFNDLLNNGKRLHDKYVCNGMAIIPVPYAAEIVALLREMPKKLTSKDMAGKLDAGIKCGEKILDSNYPWYYWMLPSSDTKPLRTALLDAGNASRIFSRSIRSMETYSPGDPVYDEFLRRLTRIWIEAAGLYGIQETRQTAVASAKDVALDRAKKAPSNLLWLLGVAGVSYLGLRWFFGSPTKTVVIAVPVDDLGDDDGKYEEEGE